MLGWPGGPGFWLVLRHADVRARADPAAAVLLLARRHPDPRPGEPGGPRLRPADDAQHGPAGAFPAAAAARRSFTPRAVARLEQRIRGHARALADRVLRGPGGECDFAKDVAADLPLLTLADMLGDARPGPLAAVRLVEPGDRLPGPGLRTVGRVRPVRRHADGPRGARAAARARPDGRMPDPRTREGMPDLYAYAHLLAEEKRRQPGRRRHVDPARPCRRRRARRRGGRRTGLGRGVREHVLAVRGGRQRDAAQRLARGLHRAARAPGGAGRAARRPRPARRPRWTRCCAGGRRS